MCRRWAIGPSCCKLDGRLTSALLFSLGSLADLRTSVRDSHGLRTPPRTKAIAVRAGPAISQSYRATIKFPRTRRAGSDGDLASWNWLELPALHHGVLAAICLCFNIDRSKSLGLGAQSVPIAAIATRLGRNHRGAT